MSTIYFPPIHTWQLADGVLRDSMRELARDGIKGNEGVVLWLGRRGPGRAEVTHLVVPEGRGVIKEPGLLVIAPAVLSTVTDLTIELGVVLLGQIHSHGPRGGVDLSPTDRTYGLAVPYYLSLVAPDFGLRPKTRLVDCGVHVFGLGRGYRRLSRGELAERIQVVPGPRASVLRVW